MRAVVAMFKHETNTFSPVPTPIGRFGPKGPTFGESVIERFEDTQTALAGILESCRGRQIDVATPVAAAAPPSGRVPISVFDEIAEAILKEVRRGCDAVLLDLHGAMVVEGIDDGEGLLLQRIRGIAPEIPIGLALDMHANLSDVMVSASTILTGYRTYPHVDVRATGKRAADLLLAALFNEIKPVMKWRRLPMLPHTLRMATAENPMRPLMAMTETMESPLIDASVFGGFPLADTPDTGMSVVAIANKNETAATEHCKAMAARAWQSRDEFVFSPQPLRVSIAQAKCMPRDEKPIILVDHSDNSASGGTQDRMEVIEEALSQGLTDMTVFAICDPEAVAQCADAGIGNEVSCDIGGKVPITAIQLPKRPLHIRGVVRTLSDGTYIARGPMFKGVRYAMGRTCVLALPGEIDLVLCERHHEPWDLGCLLSLGIDPHARRFLLLKSRVHFRAAFAPISTRVVNCDGAGVTSSKYEIFDFQHIRRPIFPLDANAQLTA